MSGVSGGVSLPAIPGAQAPGSRPSSRADSASGFNHNHGHTHRGGTPNAYHSGYSGKELDTLSKLISQAK
ncbi:hypothetical protein BaRGS_00024604 [Batillaria attramentaria]|uniref:Uncharacterized protein n=1 Tax=Batillaria attramentaria TaxID=370345 RepID=A0ABD0KAT1_9CAEN